LEKKSRGGTKGTHSTEQLGKRGGKAETDMSKWVAAADCRRIEANRGGQKSRPTAAPNDANGKQTISGRSIWETVGNESRTLFLAQDGEKGANCGKDTVWSGKCLGKRPTVGHETGRGVKPSDNEVFWPKKKASPPGKTKKKTTPQERKADCKSKPSPGDTKAFVERRMPHRV